MRNSKGDHVDVLAQQKKKAALTDLTTKEYPSWCLGCGDHTILFAMKNALVELNIDPHDIVIVSGIGCLPPGEKVSAGNEWVQIEELTRDDTIINGEGKFTNIQFKTVNHFEGNMLEIVPFVSPFNTIRLTPEHPVLCVRRNSIRSRNQINEKKLSTIEPTFVEAGDLQKGDYIVFNWNREIKDNPAYTKEFCRLLGY